jgi:hypothetical protein
MICRCREGQQAEAVNARIAAKHYLQVTEGYFQHAAKSDAPGVQNACSNAPLGLARIGRNRPKTQRVAGLR